MLTRTEEKTLEFLKELDSDSKDIDEAVIAWTMMIPALMFKGYSPERLKRMLSDHIAIADRKIMMQ